MEVQVVIGMSLQRITSDNDLTANIDDKTMVLSAVESEHHEIAAEFYEV